MKFGFGAISCSSVRCIDHLPSDSRPFRAGFSSISKRQLLLHGRRVTGDQRVWRDIQGYDGTRRDDAALAERHQRADGNVTAHGNLFVQPKNHSRCDQAPLPQMQMPRQ